MRVKVGIQKRPQQHVLRRVAGVIILVMLLCVSLQARSDSGPLVAAASSLRSIWPQLMEQYTAGTGNPTPRVSFASSGLLSTQIMNGAPFELFLSADRQSIERLPEALLTSNAQVYATGELQLVVPIGSSLSEHLSLESVATALQNSESALRIAIPNPVHAPYGRAAREVLVSAGIWPVPESQLLAAENAAQTLQFVQSGAVDVALVPQSLVYAYREGIESVVLPANSYTLVEHTIVSLRTADADAQALLEWMLSDAAQALLRASGLGIPGR